MKTLADRFWEKVKRVEGPGCWEWIGARLARPVTKAPGYGVLNVRKKTAYAHRISWQLHFGNIPEGMCVLHRCDNMKCVRPDHLFLGTKLDNAVDMAKKGRGSNQYIARPITHCKRGHEFSPINTRIDVHGNRVCRRCAADWAIRARAIKKAEESHVI